ncbi:AMP-binding protein [Actinomycetospora chiangmaiensis]|uniref:AMP-binding protein n=1 Tax=Actinomycetospora chiangmaiensis TaxID=402650 RepID=UPI00037D2AA8|nr:AMP-binding protein [Actinomycetospora chiangmaiensis]
MSGLLLALREAEREQHTTLPTPLAGGAALRAWAAACSVADNARANAKASAALELVGQAARLLGTALCRLRATGAGDLITEVLEQEAVVHDCTAERLVAELARAHGVLSAPDHLSAALIWQAVEDSNHDADQEPTVPVIEPDLSLTPVLEQLWARGEAVLVEADTGREVRGVDLAESVTAQACGWREAFPGGATVGISGPNSAVWLSAMLGAVAGGMRVATIHPLSPARDIADQLRRAGAVALLAAGDVVEHTRGVLDDVAVTVLDDALLGRRAPRSASPAAPGPEAVVTLMNSSGTTGPPKTVLMTQEAWTVSAARLAQRWHITADDVYLAVLPLSHAAGLSATMGALAAGARVVTLPRFEPEAFLDCLEHHAVTALLGAPPILRVLAAAADHRRFPSLRLVASAGAPLPAELHREVEARLGVAACNAYGMTETGWITVDDAAGPREPGVLGRPLPEVAWQVVDPDTGEVLPAGRDGELWVRGPACSPGYLGDPDATAQLVTADGWTRTGDLVVADEHGRLRIVDRLKELIKYNGHQVTPSALEALVAERSDVVDVAVVARPDPAAGEIPHAFVVPRGQIDPAELMAWVAARVAPQQRIRSVSVVDGIPRSPAGKLLRRALLAQLPPPTHDGPRNPSPNGA